MASKVNREHGRVTTTLGIGRLLVTFFYSEYWRIQNNAVINYHLSM